MTTTCNPTERTEKEQDDKIWYAIRTFNCQEQKVSRFLTEQGCIHFIPMTVTLSKVKGNETSKRILVPAIHNLLFIKKMDTQKQTLQLLKECPIPISVFRNPGENKLCEIPERDMIELRMLCDPQFNDSVYMTQNEAENMIGKEVRVVAGTFKGSIGKLIRRNKHYYFLKIVTGIGVMVRISRWYCEPLTIKQS